MRDHWSQYILFTCLSLVGVLGVLIVISPGPARAQTSGIAFSVQASTMGPSGGVHIRATESLQVRLRGSYLPYTYSREIDGDKVTADATGEFTLGGPEVRAEWYPFDRSFFLSGGALVNLTEVEAEVIPTEPYEYSKQKTFSPEKLGTLDATASYSTLAPYVGLGYGDALQGRWSFLVELGAYYTGSPNVSMNGTGLIKPTEQNATVLEDGFESFVLFPHLALGLSYQF